MVTDVTTFPENQNYVLGVCISIYCSRFDWIIIAIFKDFEEKVNREAAESVQISYLDFESTDTWLMKQHCKRNICDILNADAYVEQDVVAINNHNDGNAGNQYGSRKYKLGEAASSSVTEIVNLIKFCQKLQNGSNKPEFSSFMIVRTMGKLFTLPVRYKLLGLQILTLPSIYGFHFFNPKLF